MKPKPGITFIPTPAFHRYFAKARVAADNANKIFNHDNYSRKRYRRFKYWNRELTRYLNLGLKHAVKGPV